MECRWNIHVYIFGLPSLLRQKLSPNDHDCWIHSRRMSSIYCQIFNDITQTTRFCCRARQCASGDFYFLVISTRWILLKSIFRQSFVNSGNTKCSIQIRYLHQYRQTHLLKHKKGLDNSKWHFSHTSHPPALSVGIQPET